MRCDDELLVSDCRMSLLSNRRETVGYIIVYCVAILLVPIVGTRCDSSLKRPVFVSVYGHPSYEITVYRLNVVLRESKEEDNINFELLDIERNSPIFSDKASSLSEVVDEQTRRTEVSVFTYCSIL